MKKCMPTIVTAAAAWLVPVAAFAVGAPPLPDTPFFGWLAIPVVAVVGHKALKGRKEKDRDSL